MTNAPPPTAEIVEALRTRGDRLRREAAWKTDPKTAQKFRDAADLEHLASSRLAALAAENERMREALEAAREHIDGEIDVVDGDYGEPRPNAAMRLASMIDAALPSAREQSK